MNMIADRNAQFYRFLHDRKYGFNAVNRRAGRIYCCRPGRFGLESRRRAAASPNFHKSRQIAGRIGIYRLPNLPTRRKLDKIQQWKSSMAGSVNKVILVGNLGRDPEVRTFPSGGQYCNLAVATSESWRDKSSGERREKTEWHRVTIFSEPLVRVAEQYLKKGAKVYLEGQLETRKWQDQSGQERYSTEVALRPFRSELQMLDKRESSGSYNQADDRQADDRQADDRQAASAPVGRGPDDIDEQHDDELPF